MSNIQDYLKEMVKLDASDLYFTVDSPAAFKVNGKIQVSSNQQLSNEIIEKLALSLCNENQWNDFNKSNECNLGVHFKDIGRFRVNLFKQRCAVGIVIRQIKTTILTVDQLQLPIVLKDVSLAKRGLVLVVGATGSGKSTTLAAMLDHRNSESQDHIITIEDPIEYVHPHKKSIVNQREVGIDTESYHIALKNALRQAPDVILVGEIRDRDTMEAALGFSETGHLCLATLHASNSNQALERILSFFPADAHNQILLQLSVNLRAIISQRLVRSVNENRIAAMEILLDSPRVRDLVHKGDIATLKTVMENGSTQGMQSFDDHLFYLYQSKFITLDEALKNADSYNNLRLRIKLLEDSKEIKKLPAFS